VVVYRISSQNAKNTKNEKRKKENVKKKKPKKFKKKFTTYFEQKFPVSHMVPILSKVW
jgi:hypothetical protein